MNKGRPFLIPSLVKTSKGDILIKINSVIINSKTPSSINIINGFIKLVSTKYFSMQLLKLKPI